MLQPPPPEPGSLADLRPVPLAGERLYRVWRHDMNDGTTRPNPWWFNSVDPANPQDSGRFDLPAPQGTMHLGRTGIVAWLETTQLWLTDLPVDELRVRRLAVINPYPSAPPAADMTDPAISAIVTQGLWGSDDHALPQQWAAAIRRDGWWALSCPSLHAAVDDPHSVALFNPTAGAHEPTHGGGAWGFAVDTGAEDELVAELIARGVRIRGPANLPAAPHPATDNAG